MKEWSQDKDPTKKCMLKSLRPTHKQKQQQRMSCGKIELLFNIEQNSNGL